MCWSTAAGSSASGFELRTPAGEVRIEGIALERLPHALELEKNTGGKNPANLDIAGFARENRARAAAVVIEQPADQRRPAARAEYPAAIGSAALCRRRPGLAALAGLAGRCCSIPTGCQREPGFPGEPAMSRFWPDFTAPYSFQFQRICGRALERDTLMRTSPAGVRSSEIRSRSIQPRLTSTCIESSSLRG